MSYDPVPEHLVASETGMDMSGHRSWSLALLAFLIVAAPGAQASAQDWVQWHGPNRDGVVPSFQAPATWPEQLKAG